MERKSPTAVAGLAFGALFATACAVLAGLEDSQLAPSAPDGDVADTGAPVDSTTDAPAFDASIDASDASFDASKDASDAAAFSPLQLGAGLVVWLDGSKSVTVAGGKVAKWADQSTHGNDAVQAIVANQPTVDSAAVAQKDAIKFDGAATGLTIADNSTLDWALDDYTIDVVAAYTNVASTSDIDGYGTLFTKGADTFPYPGAAFFGNSIGGGSSSRLMAQVKTPADTSSLGWVNSAMAGLNDGAFRVLGTRRVGGTTLEARVSGVATSATVAAVDASSAGQPVSIGSSLGATGQFLKGDIAEMVAYHGPLSDADVAKLEAYLKAKYGL